MSRPRLAGERRLRYKHLMCQSFIPLLLVAVLTACAGRPHAVIPDSPGQAPRQHPLYIVNHGWHTGVVLRAQDVQGRLPFVSRHFTGAGYYEFGWGDAAFYQADTVTSGLALRAVLWPSESVMFVRPLARSPDRLYPPQGVVELRRSAAELESLATFVVNSFRYNAEGEAVPGAQAMGSGGRFYQGTGRYTLFNTCNTWTAKALQSAGYVLEDGSIITAGALMAAVAEQRQSGPPLAAGAGPANPE